jgi:hypothetical protein
MNLLNRFSKQKQAKGAAPSPDTKGTKSTKAPKGGAKSTVVKETKSTKDPKGGNRDLVRCSMYPAEFLYHFY